MSSAAADDPLCYFRMLVDDEIIDLMVEQTNLHAAHARAKQWTDTDRGHRQG